MFVNHGLPVIALIVLLWLSCFPVDPQTQRFSGTPQLSCTGMAPVADPVDGYHEAVHLTWTFDEAGDQPVLTYTLLRKLSSDSVFDVFSHSRQIPATTTEFYDDLADQAYPLSGIDSITYRIFAVDSLGRSSDTSTVCVFLLASQPSFNSYTSSTRCLEWESWIRGGSTSWCVVWSDEAGRTWTSSRRDEFPFTDKPALFTACLPDTLDTPAGMRWFYALYIKANEAYSLKIGEVDVP